MATSDSIGAPKKKPYVRPELERASVYEAAGATCCKVTATACPNKLRTKNGKQQARSVVS